MIVRIYQLFINGRWQPSTSGELIPVINPANEAIIAYIQDGNAEDAQQALQAAQAAHPSWAALPAIQRAGLLRAISEKLSENQEFLAHLLTTEQGKPFTEAVDEVDGASTF